MRSEARAGSSGHVGILQMPGPASSRAALKSKTRSPQRPASSRLVQRVSTHGIPTLVDEREERKETQHGDVQTTWWSLCPVRCLQFFLNASHVSANLANRVKSQASSHADDLEKKRTNKMENNDKKKDNKNELPNLIHRDLNRLWFSSVCLEFIRIRHSANSEDDVLRGMIFTVDFVQQH